MTDLLFSDTTEALYARLPDAFRDADSKQTKPGPLPALAAVTNVITNPDFETNAAGWTTDFPGTTTLSRDTTQFHTGSASLKVVQTSATSDIYTSPFFPIGASKDWAGSLWVKGAAGLQIRAIICDDSGGEFASGGWVTLTGVWQRVTVFGTTTHTPAPGYVYAGVYTNGVGTYYFDDFTLVAGLVPQDFNGSTTGDTRYQNPWSWTGTPHASTSVQAARSADPGGYPLKRWLSGVIDQVGDMETLLNRILITTPDDGGDPNDKSDLADPLTADAAWLPWIAQVLGKKLLSGATTDQQRAYLNTAGYTSGNTAAIAAAAATRLTGTKSVQVYDHTTNAGSIGTGGQWDVAVVTKASETPGGVDPVADVIALGAKPAGIKLWARSAEATWNTLEATYTTWDAWDAKNWTQIEETGL